MRPCATCVVAQHSPVVTAPAPAAIRPLVIRLIALLPSHAVPAAGERPTHAGRAPPPSADEA